MLTYMSPQESAQICIDLISAHPHISNFQSHANPLFMINHNLIKYKSNTSI